MVIIGFMLIVAMAFLFSSVLGLVTMTLTKNIVAVGTNGTQTVEATGEVGVKANPTVPVALAGTLSTRTSDTAGTLTMETGHGITDGARLDIYWTGGRCYGATVGTVAGLSVPFTGAAGTVLPIATTAITACIPNEAVFNVVGDNMQGLLFKTTSAGYFVIADGSGNLFAQYVASNSSYSWIYGEGVTNPIAGDTATKVFMSQESTAAAVTTAEAVAVVA